MPKAQSSPQTEESILLTSDDEGMMVIHDLLSSDNPTANRVNANQIAKQLLTRESLVQEQVAEERKRKREEAKETKKSIKQRLLHEEEKIRIHEDSIFEANKELYKIFNSLQGISRDFGVEFETPELVVVGGQSDGKSTFIEALLGFQFNIVESTMGTRRPLVLMMINNPKFSSPICRFRKESGVLEYCSADEDFDGFEEVEVPVESLNSEIQYRTNAIAGTGDHVSPAPIILRVEYKHCATLTVIDLPGLRVGGDAALKRAIEQMVLQTIKPHNRIIICIEQSTVEWANSLVRPIVRLVDPQFNRTVLVITKFDNRIKELRSKEEAHKYLAGEDLPEHLRPFYVSLPVKRGLDSKELKSAIKKCYLGDLKWLLQIEFDENRFGDHIGFYQTKRYLEKLLNSKYHAFLRPTMLELEKLCEDTKKEIQALEMNIEANSIELQRDICFNFVHKLVTSTHSLMDGSIAGNPDINGETIEEERQSSGHMYWPSETENLVIEESNLKLYGGAQFHRLMREFEQIVFSTAFSSVSDNEIAAALSSAKYHNIPCIEKAAIEIVRVKSKAVLIQFINVLLGRVSHVMMRMFNIAVGAMRQEESCSGSEICFPCDSFQSSVRLCHHNYVKNLETKCKTMLIQSFFNLTEYIDWNMLEELVMNEKDGEQQINRTPVFAQIRVIANRLFEEIKQTFVKECKQLLNGCFLRPMFQDLGKVLFEFLRKINDEELVAICELGTKQKKDLIELLMLRLTKVEEQKQKFQSVYTQLSTQLGISATENRARK